MLIYMLIWCLCTIPVLYAFSETHGWVCFVPPSWSVSPLYFTIRMAWPFTCITVEDIRFVFEKMAYIIKKNQQQSNVLQLVVPRGTHGLRVYYERISIPVFLIHVHVWRTFLEILGAQPSLSQSAPVGLFFITCICPSLGRQLNWRFRKRTFIFLCATFYKEYGYHKFNCFFTFWFILQILI